MHLSVSVSHRAWHELGGEDHFHDLTQLSGQTKRKQDPRMSNVTRQLVNKSAVSNQAGLYGDVHVRHLLSLALSTL